MHLLYLHLIRRSMRFQLNQNGTELLLVEALLNNQHTDGGWTYNSSGSKDSASSVDVTGMVLSALAPIKSDQM